MGVAKKVVVTSHIYPDGDAIGSSVSFLNLMKRLKKNAVSINPAPIPPVYRFLDRERNLLVYTKRHDRILSNADVLFILDASANDRLGPLYEVAQRLKIQRVCIDHHPDNRVDATVKVVDTEACSTAQLVYELYRALGVDINADIAEALYTGMHTDTVSFNFLGTNAKTHEIVAELLRAGVDPKKTWLKIYGNDTPELLKLAGVTLSGLRVADEGRIAWLTVRQNQWKELGVDPNATEAFTRFPLTIRGVGVIAVFCEEEKSRVRVSLRALGDIDVGALARTFGGGGHRTSAGATVCRPLELVIEEVIDALTKNSASRRKRFRADEMFKARGTRR
jgi:phosphoesterase RecJ-like protein